MSGLGIAAIVFTAYVAGRGSRQPGVREISASQVMYYVDPMHPSYRSDRPGKAPDCGMDLVPVYAGEKAAQQRATNPGSVRLTRNQEDAIRLQTETAQTGTATHELHTVGRVVPDEALTYRVSAGV